MNSNWKKYKLHQVAEIKYGKDHKLLKSGSIPVYGSGGVMRYGDNFLYDKPSILIPRKGTLSNLFYVDKPFWSVDTMFWSKIAEGTLPKYLFYNLKTLDLASMDVGSAVPSLTTELLNKIEITLPPLPEQQAIAEILSSLDDKIELNLQTNKTLEEMANALYKNWFVDFGPFKAGKFIESELGMIPEGWEVKRLDQFLTVKRGGSPRPIQDFLRPTGLPWVKISDATASDSPFLLSTQEFIRKEGLSKTVLLSEGSLILSNSASPGIPKFLTLDACIHDGWLHFPEINRLNKYILFLLFLRIKEYLISQGNGSVFTNLKTDILKSQLTVLPPIEIENQFTSMITEWFHLIRQNSLESQALRKTRDYLLPKLISGEIQVKQASKLAKQFL